MKLLKYIAVVIFLYCSACKTTNVITKTTTIKKIPAKRIAKKHIAAYSNKESVAAKLSVHYKSPKESLRFSVKLRMLKDSVIWLKGTKLITVFKAKITPNGISYYSSLERKYFEGDFAMLEKLIGVKIHFNQLQHLLLGEAIYNLKDQKYTVNIAEKSYVLTPKIPSKLLQLLFKINPIHYKLDEQSISSVSKNKTLQILYKDYILKDNTAFPTKIHLKATNKNSFTNLFIDLKQVDFNENLNFSYRVPQGYKRIEIE